LWPGFGAALGVAVVIAGSFAAVIGRAETGVTMTAADYAVFRFTIVQAVLSAVLSVGLSIPVARALARRSFPGRRVLILFLGAPFILPVIVAVMGLLSVFGRSGWVSDLLALVGVGPLRIYGLHGVVLAHVFFNLPLAVRLILQGWQEIPAERFRLAAHLGTGSWEIWRLLERPMLVRILPGILAVIFAICLTSFAVALTLGGGPRATTIELAIYQAFRFDFDLGRAAVLSICQVAVAGIAALVALRLAGGAGFGAGLDRVAARWDTDRIGLKCVDGAVIAVAALFLLAPLVAVILRGVTGLAEMPLSVLWAAVTSVLVALTSTGLLLALAIPIAASLASGRVRSVELAGILGLAASPLAIGTGLFILVNPVTDPARVALPVTALINAVMALPFALRALVPATRDVVADYGRLALSLDLTGGRFMRIVFLRRLAPQIGFSAGLGAALSMGDLGVIALFADPDRATLPLQVYRLMGAYRMEASAGAALVLLGLSLALFWVFDAGGRWFARTG